MGKGEEVINRQHYVIAAFILASAMSLTWYITKSNVRGATRIVPERVRVEVDKPWPISDLVTGRPYRYGDFKACQGVEQVLWDWHFTGEDRSVRNQLTPPAQQVVNDSSLPFGYMRVFDNSQHVVEGHVYGGNLVVQFHGQVRAHYPLGRCGPERGRAPAPAKK